MTTLEESIRDRHGIDERSGRSPNAPHIGRLMKLKDDHLSRLVGIKVDQAHDFKVSMSRWMKEYTEFPSLNFALKNFLPIFKEQNQ